jgi:integrase
MDGMTQNIDDNRANNAQRPASLQRAVELDEMLAPPSLANQRHLPRLPSGTTAAPLFPLTDRERRHVAAAGSANTRRAYASDWAHFSAWCRRSGLLPLPPDPQVIGRYVTACASGLAERGIKPHSVSTIERRLSSLCSSYAERGMPLDRKDRHIATVMAGIRKSFCRPPVQKEAITAADIVAMLETLDRRSLRGMRDRAMLLIGYAGGLRRSEIVGLDLQADQTEDGLGWIDISGQGLIVTLRGKTGWREVMIVRGSLDTICPVVATEIWIRFAKLSYGPLFRRVIGQGKLASEQRLNDKEVARLVKRTVMAAGLRGDLNESDRATKFSGHSLRAGLASPGEVE